MFVLVYCVLKTKDISDYFEWDAVRKSLAHALFGSVCIAAIAHGIKLVLTPGLYRISIVIPVCVLAYAIILIVFHEQILFDVLKKVKITIGKK